MKRLMTAAIAIATLIAAPLAAHDYKIGELVVAHPYAPTTPGRAKSAVGYMSITNNGSVADTLIDVRTDVANALLHRTESGDDGIMRMPHMGDGIVIAPGETVTMEPGGLHIMFMGLSAPFTDGEKFAGTLVFEHAGEVEVNFNIEARGSDAMDGMTHEGHGN